MRLIFLGMALSQLQLANAAVTVTFAAVPAHPTFVTIVNSPSGSKSVTHYFQGEYASPVPPSSSFPEWDYSVSCTLTESNQPSLHGSHVQIVGTIAMSTRSETTVTGPPQSDGIGGASMVFPPHNTATKSEVMIIGPGTLSQSGPTAGTHTIPAFFDGLWFSTAVGTGSVQSAQIPIKLPVFRSTLTQTSPSESALVTVVSKASGTRKFSLTGINTSTGLTGSTFNFSAPGVIGSWKPNLGTVQLIASSGPLPFFGVGLQSSIPWRVPSNAAPSGTYDAVVWFPGFLPIRLPNVAVGSTTPAVIAVDLIAGDVNSDNEIDAADIDFIISHFGKTPTSADWNGKGKSTASAARLADINLDDEVDAADVDLAILHFGQVGEEFQPYPI